MIQLLFSIVIKDKVLVIKRIIFNSTISVILVVVIIVSTNFMGADFSKSFTLISALEDEESYSKEEIENVCKQNTKFCEKVPFDSYCSEERGHLVVSRDAFIGNDSDENQYEYMVDLENMIKCTEKHSHIQYKNPRNRHIEQDKLGIELTPEVIKKRETELENYASKQSRRFKTLHYLQEQLEHADKYALKQETPYLLYWNWSRHQNQDAFDKLIAYEEKHGLSDSQLNFMFAQGMVKYDMDKANDLISKSLKYYDHRNYIPMSEDIKDAPIHVQAFRFKYKYNLNKGNYDRAYIYGKLLILNNDQLFDKW